MSTQTEIHNKGAWTTAELAEAAGLSDARIRQLLLAKEIQGYKAGRDWRIADHVARTWLAQRERGQ